MTLEAAADVQFTIQLRTMKVAPGKPSVSLEQEPDSKSHRPR